MNDLPPGLLACILAEPEVDAPRLVYADWLEEHGEVERAEFIRVQCELATLKPYTLTWDGTGHTRRPSARHPTG